MRVMLLILCPLMILATSSEGRPQEPMLPRATTPHVVNWPVAGEGEWKSPEGMAYVHLRCTVTTKQRRITLGQAEQSPPVVTDVLGFSEFALILPGSEKVTAASVGVRDGEPFQRAARAPSGSLSLINVDGKTPCEWEIEVLFLIPAKTAEASFQFGKQKAEPLRLPKGVSRTWTDRTGRQLKGEFVGFAEGQVQVRRESDGKTVHVPLERFSDADQAFVRSASQPDSLLREADAPPKASLTISSVALERGELTAEIAWGEMTPEIKAEEIALVLLFQTKAGPLLKLDAPTLAKMSNNWEVGLLDNGCTWVLRTTGDAKSREFGEVLQVVSGSGKARETPDFRKDGKYPIRFRLSYAGGRGLSVENVQVALCRETDSMKWQQSSTSYQLLSNVVKLPRIPMEPRGNRLEQGE